jgi:glycosyltransferase involved in cell wall biosynthesis
LNDPAAGEESRRIVRATAGTPSIVERYVAGGGCVKPRIVFFIPGLSVGGAEVHTVKLRERLDHHGYDTMLLVYGPRRAPSILANPGAKDATFLDIRGMSDPRGWLTARAALARTSADLIVAINQVPLIVAVASRLTGATKARIACIFHTTILRESERSRFFLFRWALRLADLLVYVSANQMRYWTDRRLTCRRQNVVLNGIDLDHFNPSMFDRAAERRALGIADHELVLGMVAAFRAEKNHKALIDAVSALRLKGIPARALLVGGGETRERMGELAKQLGVEANVMFAGEQSDVRRFIVACDAGVLCSKAVETFSLSALEFLAMGVPMAMSRIGGASEIVDDGANGLLFAPDNLDDMLAKLQALADYNVRAAMAKAARPSVERLSFEEMLKHYIDLIEQLTADGAAG